jgi:hypothetical protein
VDSKSTNERGPSLVGSFGLSCRHKRFLFCLGYSLVGPVQNIFFPHRIVHYLNSFVPIVQKAGQAVMLGRLSLMCVSLVFTLVKNINVIISEKYLE